MNFDERANSYKKYRKADSRLVDVIEELLCLKKDSLIADIGAGVGNYSLELINRKYKVVSIEPEEKMINNSISSKISWVNSFAEKIDLPNDTVDGAIIINAIHHFSSIYEGIKESFRIIKNGGRLLIFTFDPSIAKQIWLFDYWPELKKYEDNHYLELRKLKSIIERIFEEKVEEYVFKMPHDFQDIFSAAIWKRPYILFENEAREAMSLFSYCDYDYIKDGLKELKGDLISGKWEEKYCNLSENTSIDVGCRILCVKKNFYEREW